MTHTQVLKALRQDLDDLRVRNPAQYAQREQELNTLQRKANLDVALSPVGVRRMERLH